MTDEPDLLAEIHAHREEFARKHNYDVFAMGETLRKLEVELRAAGWKFVAGTPRPPAYVPAELPPIHLPGSDQPLAEPQHSIHARQPGTAECGQL